MCNLSSTVSEIKQGYKVLALKDNKFYSSFTGEEYTIGPVDLPPVRCNRLASWSSMLDVDKLCYCPFFNIQYKGYSSAFLDIEHALALIGDLDDGYSYDVKLVVVKIEFDGEVLCGYYDNNDIIAGKIVKSLELIGQYV